jgi:colanic acid/amylovoran biosynthesis glycosyltransferase
VRARKSGWSLGRVWSRSTNAHPQPELVGLGAGSRGPEPSLINRVIAYITTGYPALSHTFILREVEALRRRGAEISTTSVHRASSDGLLSEADRHAFATTYALLPPRWRDVARAHLLAAVKHPHALWSTLRLALKLGRPGWRGRLWQVFYFGEAVTAWAHWRRLGIRHVHAHFMAVPSDVALLASHLGRLADSGPTSWSFTVHGMIEVWDVQSSRLAEKVRRAEAVVCISDFTRSQLMALVEEHHWPKLRVIRCGVRPTQYSGIGEPPPGRPRILSVGRLVPEKGQSLLLRALALLAERGVDAELELVGDGPNREKLGRLAAELGLEDRVRFAGAIGQDAIAAHYESATLFCLPSFCEGIPVVLMEAMACRRAVIATAVSGVRELVRDGDTGVLVSPGREDELADALQMLIADAALRRRLGDAAQRHVARRYDVDDSATQLSMLFAEVMGDSPAESEPVRASDQGNGRPEPESISTASAELVAGR